VCVRERAGVRIQRSEVDARSSVSRSVGRSVCLSSRRGWERDGWWLSGVGARCGLRVDDGRASCGHKAEVVGVGSRGAGG
jgi:hypothetical protein